MRATRLLLDAAEYILTSSMFWTLSLLYIALQLSSWRKIDNREPHVVRLGVPYVGALIGMIIHGGRWLRDLAIRIDHPIFTIPMPGSRMYIISDPALAAIAQRNKNLSFNPVIPEATKRILGLDAETVQLVRNHLNREDGIRGFIPELHDMIYTSMAPGASLDELSMSASYELARLVEEYCADLPINGANNKKEEDLLNWCQHQVTVATARFLYGPHNPIDVDRGNEKAFWDFDHDIGFLLVHLVPSITARKAYLGRERLAMYMEKYLKAGHHRQASPLIQRRVEISLKHGFKFNMLARGEISFLFAGIVNTAITSFWFILHIVSRPALLSEIRGELGTAFGPATSAQHALDSNKIREQCPIFMSVFRETLRTTSETSSTRIVMEDTLLGDQYFLRKDSVLQIAGGAMHRDPDIWGSNVDHFDPYRFLETDRKSKEKIHPAAYRAFGGGATLCPGRHFATNEITSFVALVIMLFDIETLDRKPFSIPKKKDNVLPVHVLEPMSDLKCIFTLRKLGSGGI